jgi:hypothetical protein
MDKKEINRQKYYNSINIQNTEHKIKQRYINIINYIKNNYIITNNKDNKISVKEIYNNFILTDLFINSTKIIKRLYNFKNFIKAINNDDTLKKYIVKIRDKYYIRYITLPDQNKNI